MPPEVPPPWIPCPDYHPLSMGFRMGHGEDHWNEWWAYWKSLELSESERIRYFKEKYPPPPRWLPWVSYAIWELDLNYDISNCPYVKKLIALGFATEEEVRKDLDDPQWI